MRGLVVLYDARCGFCVRCRRWLEAEPKFLPLEFLAAGSSASRARFPTLPAPEEAPEELVVVDDEGGLYYGAEAWIICLYALRDYREWSVRLARPALRPLARVAFEWLSRNRKSLSRRLGLTPEEELVTMLKPMSPSLCDLDAKRSLSDVLGGFFR